MTGTNRLIMKLALVAVITVTGMMPFLRPASAAAQRGGESTPNPRLPENPVVVPIPTISGEVTGPGDMFPSLMEFHSGDDMAHYGYEAQEYFVSGIANGRQYRTRIVIRKPADNSRSSGLVLAESMHPGGNAWMFHFTHTYTMSSGHIGLEIVTSPPAQFTAHNAERYKDLQIEPAQGPEIIAQVGALIRSDRSGNPLAGLPLRKMILAGTSASAAALIRYLPAHMVYRLPDMKPIYDGFLPTSTGATIRQVDVPLIQVPTMTEVISGNATARQDGDAPGDQFRVYEFAGMAHLDTREAEGYYPDPCKHPISRFPLGAYMSVALHHLFQWVDKGIAPPRAERILTDRNVTNDGSVMALDEYGNPIGGIRNPYVDVPVMKYGVRNEPAVPPIPDAHPFISARGDGAAAFTDLVCGLAGYQTALSDAQLRRLYRDKAAYSRNVEARLEELTTAGWSLPVYRDMILRDAAGAEF